MKHGLRPRKHSVGLAVTAPRPPHTAPPILLLVLGVAVAGSACAGPAPRRAEAEPPRQTPVDTGRTIQPGAPEPGEWTLPGRDYAGTRYSPLAQVTTGNAATLRLAWSFSTGLARGFEGQPLVVDGTMYVVTPYPNKVFAIDLSRPGGPLRWSYTPPTDPASQGEACCDVVNRGASYADGKLVFNRLDNVTVALDAKNGKVAWQTTLGDIAKGETMTMAPLIVGKRVFVGNSGGEMGVRGWITALDLGSGKVLWQATNTGPDQDVKIGARFKPAYAWLRGKDLGVSSWPGEQWKIGGGTVWGWITYDPELDLLFYGSGNPGVWNPDLRPGDNLWTTAIFARDPASGEAVWAYPTTPHDAWDYDAINENLPLDLTIEGKPRKALLQMGRTGYVYLLDRETGAVISATPFEHVNWSSGVDLKTGRPQVAKDKETHEGVNTTGICPAATGAKDQQPAAFSFRTGLIYSPATNLCMDYKGTSTGYIAGTPYVGAEVMMYPGPGGNRGEFIAWDPAAARKVWAIPERFPVWTGGLVTAGDVVFYGTMEGWFKAVDARSGKVLWRIKTGSGAVGNPITYLGPDGKQYVAVYSGVGGWSGAVALGLDTTDPTAALGFVNGMKDLPSYSQPGGMVYVFSLP
jgi:PQQ-dependent dehydrogenase (methanol/ethanol family)